MRGAAARVPRPRVLPRARGDGEGEAATLGGGEAMSRAGAGAEAGGVEQVSAELFNGLYGAFVFQLLQDFDHVGAVNAELEAIGHSVGVRFVDELLAKLGTARVGTFEEAVRTVVEQGFRAFFGAGGQVSDWSGDRTRCRVLLEDVPMMEHTEIPEHLADLQYTVFLSGLIKGSLEQLGMHVEVDLAAEAGQDPRAFAATVKLTAHDNETYP